MLPTDTIVRQVDLRLGERRPEYFVLLLLRAETGGFRIAAHEGAVGLDGRPCYHTGRFTSTNAQSCTSESAADEAFAEAIRFRSGIGFVAAPADRSIPFTHDAKTSDATAHVRFETNIGVKLKRATCHLESHLAIPQVARAAAMLASAHEGIGSYHVLRTSELLPCVAMIARSGCARLTSKGKVLSARAIADIAVRSVGDARFLFEAFGFLGRCPDDLAGAIGVPATALVL